MWMLSPVSVIRIKAEFFSFVMPLSKDQVTAIIRKRRYKSLYKYIEHLQYWAAMKQWEYSRSHAGYDAAAVPQYVYRYWHKRAMEISNYIQLVVHPNDHLWLLDQLVE